jgi:two-component system NarL family sensor kinase
VPDATVSTSYREAAAEAERVVAWLRLPAIALLALGQGLAHPNPQETAFLVALALFSAWSAGLLAWVHLRPAGERLALAATGVDIAAISVLAVLSGGAFSHARLAFFLVPVAVAFRFRPSITAAAAVLTTAAYVIQAVAHPATSQPEAGRFVATQAGFIAWVGLASALLSLLLARRTELVTRLAEERSRLLADALEAEQRERRTLAEALHDHALQNLLSARHELEEAGEASLHPALGRADQALADTVGQLREAVFELHPYVLEEAGLEAALRSIAQQAARRAALELRLELPARPALREPSPARATAVLRRPRAPEQRRPSRRRHTRDRPPRRDQRRARARRRGRRARTLPGTAGRAARRGPRRPRLAARSPRDRGREDGHHLGTGAGNPGSSPAADAVEPLVHSAAGPGCGIIRAADAARAAQHRRSTRGNPLIVKGVSLPTLSRIFASTSLARSTGDGEGRPARRPFGRCRSEVAAGMLDSTAQRGGRSSSATRPHCLIPASFHDRRENGRWQT